MKRMGMRWHLVAMVMTAAFTALAPGACSESPYDTTAVASQKCPKDQPAQCVATFGDPRTAGIEASQDADGPVITTFSPTAYFGDAPFRSDIAFQVKSPVAASLRCEFDAEGDGVFEQHVDCSAGSVSVAYPVPGRYAPALRVTDSAARVATASEILLSNRLVLKAGTILVDALPGLAESSVDGDVVTLTFASESQVAPLAAGAILLDRRVNGYVREVTAIVKEGAKLVAQTEERPVYDAFDSGYFGMRYAVAERLDETGAQPYPGPRPQDAPGEFELGPFRRKLSVPLPSILKLEVSGVELALEDTALDIEFELHLFEVSIPARYAFVMANSQIIFESDVSITGTKPLIDKEDGSTFLPIGPLGVGWSTPLGKAALGAVVEVGVASDLNLSVGWHQKVSSKLALDLRQTDPLAPAWSKQMQGYPPDAAVVSGPPPTFEVSNGHVDLELTGKLFAAPQVVIAVGNAAGVMRRAKKDHKKYQAECKAFKGIRMAAGFEANVSFTGSLETNSGGTSLCLRLEREAMLFAELFPGFEFCPSAELSLLDDEMKDVGKICWPSAPTCTNGEQDGNETDMDCGGSCADCANGKKCKTNADCVSNKCTGGVCTALAATCFDGVVNGNETDSDCGGSCSQCANGKRCRENSDCTSGSCEAGVCAAPGPTCPSGDGLYCGKQELGQNTSYLYRCQDGVYSVSSACNGLGCQVNLPGVDDSCVVACACAGGTCCSDGCNFDPAGTSCGQCKMCNESGSCSVNKSNGMSCGSDGTCQDGVCKVNACEYSWSVVAPDYTCAGGVVMNIAGSVDNSGSVTISATKRDGSGLGDGTYYVRVFDPDSGDPGQHCKYFNVTKAEVVVSGSPTRITFPAFASLLECGGLHKGYCVTKLDGGDGAFWCSNTLEAQYE
ncbi:hypothetical protein WME90_36860 [Sorangium sp. So ce375]|uniref:hypothetical protein n=1 Tax=Sorangium sp. So ce375 TaxID=3133306 RepID=UPI003F5BF694